MLLKLASANTARVKIWLGDLNHRVMLSRLTKRISSDLRLLESDDLLDLGYGQDDIPEIARQAAVAHLRAMKAAA